MFSGSEGFLGGLEFFLACALTLNHLSVETSLLLLMNDIVCIVVNIFILFNLLRVVDDHIGLEVKLGSV